MLIVHHLNGVVRKWAPQSSEQMQAYLMILKMIKNIKIQ